MLDLAPGTALGAYIITARIGSGGMATVYQAHHPALDRDVAIKVISHLYESQPEFLERFRREARAASRLRHPHILTVYDFGEVDDLAYMVTELLPGGTLAERLGRPVPYTEVLRVLRGIGAALDAAHGAGLIHRDVKPQNILFTRNNEPVLADFGIARAAETMASLTVEGALIGTPYYLAPEMAAGGDLSPASDLYSLGVVLYEMLAGEVPFPGTTPIAIVRAHVYDAPPSLRSKRSTISSRIEAVVMRALAKRPHDRHTSCAQLAADFERAILGPDDPPTPRPGGVRAPTFPPDHPGVTHTDSARRPAVTGGAGMTGGAGVTGSTGWPQSPQGQPPPPDPYREPGQTGATGGWQNPGQVSYPSSPGSPHQQQYPPGVPPSAYPSAPDTYTNRWPRAGREAEPRSGSGRAFFIVAIIVVVVTAATYALRVTGVIPDVPLPFVQTATPISTPTVAVTATARTTATAAVASPGPGTSPAPATTAPQVGVSPVASPSPAAVVLPSNTPAPSPSPAPILTPTLRPPTPDPRTGPLTVTISAPANGASVLARPPVSGRQTGVRAPGQHLWLLLHPDGDSPNWWPIKTEIVPDGSGTWRLDDVEIGGPPGSRHVLAVGVVDDAGHQNILRQIREKPDDPFEQGQPPGFQELTRVTVIKQ